MIWKWSVRCSIYNEYCFSDTSYASCLDKELYETKKAKKIKRTQHKSTKVTKVTSKSEKETKREKSISFHTRKEPKLSSPLFTFAESTELTGENIVYSDSISINELEV